MENNRYREEEKEMDVAPETEIVEETKEVEKLTDIMPKLAETDKLVK